MNGKMTDEDLEHELSQALSASRAAKVRAHISALTTERDDLRAEAHAAVSGLLALAEVLTNDTKEPALDAARRVVAERDALRERVRALEAERDQWRDSRYAAARERHAAESRLAAIRQRAGDTGRLGVIAWNAAYSRDVESMAEKTPRMAAAVASYILDPDAPAPSEISGLEGEMAGKPTHCDRGDCCRSDHCPCACHERPAPTTAEAFATVRAGMGGDALPSAYHKAREVLSLLERRMGALEAALRGCRAMLKCTDGCACDVCAALTDAPPVSTVPTELAALIDGFAGEVRRAEEHLANKGKGGVSVPFHGDFASVPPSSLGRLRWWADALKQGRTSAPVFTLEEVRAAGEDVAEDCEPGPVALTDEAAEAYASGWARGARTVADRVAARNRK